MLIVNFAQHRYFAEQLFERRNNAPEEILAFEPHSVMHHVINAIPFPLGKANIMTAEKFSYWMTFQNAVRCIVQMQRLVVFFCKV